MDLWDESQTEGFVIYQQLKITFLKNEKKMVLLFVYIFYVTHI